MATVEQFLAAIGDDERRDDIRALHELIRDVLPDQAVAVDGALLGYGPYHYRYASGREGDSYLVSIANRKQAISLYVACSDGDAYLPERYAPRLGQADVGKSCVRFKRLADLDLAVVRELLREAGARGGADAV